MATPIELYKEFIFNLLPADVYSLNDVATKVHQRQWNRIIADLLLHGNIKVPSRRIRIQTLWLYLSSELLHRTSLTCKTIPPYSIEQQYIMVDQAVELTGAMKGLYPSTSTPSQSRSSSPSPSSLAPDTVTEEGEEEQRGILDTVEAEDKVDHEVEQQIKDCFDTLEQEMRAKRTGTSTGGKVVKVTHTKKRRKKGLLFTDRKRSNKKRT